MAPAATVFGMYMIGELVRATATSLIIILALYKGCIINWLNKCTFPPELAKDEPTLARQISTLKILKYKIFSCYWPQKTKSNEWPVEVYWDRKLLERFVEFSHVFNKKNPLVDGRCGIQTVVCVFKINPLGHPGLVVFSFQDILRDLS